MSNAISNYESRNSDDLRQDLESPVFSAPYGKWKSALNAGFQILPDSLLKHQHRLGLGSNDLIVLINITMSWWYPDRLPYPRATTIARRMGVGIRTVQRSLRRLEELDLVKRVPMRTADASTAVAFDLSGLVRELRRLAESDPAYRNRFPVLASQMEESN